MMSAFPSPIRAIRQASRQPSTAWCVDKILMQFMPYVNLLSDAQTSVPDTFAYPMATVRALVAAQKTITLVLPAFPAKSANREKTLSHLPDLGELLALRRLYGIIEDIRAFYEPGAELVICSDGRVFSDVVGVADADVSAYRSQLLDMVRDQGMNGVSWFDLDDVYAEPDFSVMRQRLDIEYGERLGDLQVEVSRRESMRRLFNGIHRFLLEDARVRFPHLSTNQLRNLTKSDAYQVVRRSQAWSQVVAEHYPDALRLSIHPQLPSSRKLGIRLVDGDNIWRTPWHAVAVRNDDGFTLMRHVDAIRLGGRLALWAGKYPYFEFATRPRQEERPWT